MPAERKWIREYELVFVGPTEELFITSVGQRDPLDIGFQINADAKDLSQTVMDLRIFGLKESNIAKLTQPGVKVFFSVGYRDQPLTRIFTGDVRKLTVDTDSGKHETKIVCLTSRIGSKVMNKTFPEGITYLERLKDMVRTAKERIPDLNIDQALKDLDVLSATDPTAEELKSKELFDVQLLRDKVDGPYTATRTCLDEIKLQAELFFIDVVTFNDTLYFVRKGGKLVVSNPIQASLGENLLSAPRRRLDNMEDAPASNRSKVLWELNMLLEPQMAPNRIVVSTHVRNDEGNVEEKVIIIKAIEVKHSGRYRGSHWNTEIAGTVDSSYIAYSPYGTSAKELEQPYKEPIYKTPDTSKPLFRGTGATGTW